MPTTAPLRELLERVVWNPSFSSVEGLEPLRRLLAADTNREVARFLELQLSQLEGKRRGGIAFVLAEHYQRQGDIPRLQKLFGIEDTDAKVYVLNALWGDSTTDPRVGASILELALLALNHNAAEVRAEACSVIQNQCGWGVDVRSAVVPLEKRLRDEDPRVRRQASYAVGNLAKRKYQLSDCISSLRLNLRDDSLEVREASAWALAQMSRAKHDIRAALSDLVALLASEDDSNGPRKQAAGALLHHAKKSPDHARDVRGQLRSVRPTLETKEFRKFVNDLEKLE